MVENIYEWENDYDGRYGSISTKTELPKWIEVFEKVKKSRDELVRLWLNNQTEKPVIK